MTICSSLLGAEMVRLGSISYCKTRVWRHRFIRALKACDNTGSGLVTLIWK